MVPVCFSVPKDLTEDFHDYGLPVLLLLARGQVWLFWVVRDEGWKQVTLTFTVGAKELWGLNLGLLWLHRLVALSQCGPLTIFVYERNPIVHFCRSRK